MSKFRVFLVASLLSLGFVLPAAAGDLTGIATDASGGVLQSARVAVRNLATSQEVVVRSDAAGRFRVTGLAAGSYLVVIERDGFSPDARTIDIVNGVAVPEIVAKLVPGALQVGVTVTATRSERNDSMVPLRTDSVTSEAIEARAPAATGDALVLAPGVTPSARSGCRRRKTLRPPCLGNHPTLLRPPGPPSSTKPPRLRPPRSSPAPSPGQPRCARWACGL